MMQFDLLFKNIQASNLLSSILINLKKKQYCQAYEITQCNWYQWNDENLEKQTNRECILRGLRVISNEWFFTNWAFTCKIS